MKVSILGCGWLGKPLGKLLCDNGIEVKGSFRKIESAGSLQLLGIEPFYVDFKPYFTGDVAFFDIDLLVISIPPRLKTMGEAYYLQQINEIADVLSKKVLLTKVIFISSTSVYGKEPGFYTENEADFSNVLFKAEEIILNACKNSSKQCVVLRMAGLMGYDREPCKYLNAATSELATGVNYVFQDDAVRAIFTAIYGEEQGVFNICSPIHPLRGEILEHRCGVKLASKIAEKPSKLIDSQLFTDTFAFTFTFPDPLTYPKGE